ncbi:MAG TPA: hypothetical protein VF721_11270 [Pyrinomonadaceae bacterium]
MPPIDNEIKDILSETLPDNSDARNSITAKLSEVDQSIRNEVLSSIPDYSRLRDSIAAKLAALGLDEKVKTDKQNLLTLYSLEYQKAAERYQSIYVSIWTNFSYMSVVAGALLTLGSNLYSNISLIAFLASLPLIFWYVVSYIPMNRYGNDVIKRLKEIEEIFKKEFGAELDHFKKFSDRNFPRVRPAMFVFGFLLISFSCYFGYQYFFNRSSLLEQGDLIVTKELANRLITDISLPPTEKASSLPSQSPESPANTAPVQTVQFKSPPCEKIQLQKANGIDALIQSHLSEATVKSLCEFKYGNSSSASRELQRAVTGDFNKALGDQFFCEQKPDLCGETDKALYGDNKGSTENLISANRAILEKSYGNRIISPKENPPAALLILLGVFLCIFFVVGYELVLILKEIDASFLKDILKTNKFMVTSLDQNEDFVLSWRQKWKLSKLIKSKTGILLTQILPLSDPGNCEWKRGEDENLRITAFVIVDGKIKLVELNKEKVATVVSS